MFRISNVVLRRSDLHHMRNFKSRAIVYSLQGNYFDIYKEKNMKIKNKSKTSKSLDINRNLSSLRQAKTIQDEPSVLIDPEYVALMSQLEQIETERNINIDPNTADFTDPSTYHATMKPPHEAYTLHPSTYSSERFFNLEKKKVFEKSWVCVGLSSNLRLPGDTIVTELGTQPIFLVRDKHGSLNGFLNVCRHRGAKLVSKNGRNSVISCKYHRWGYALDGRLLATPLWDTVEGGQRFDAKTNTYKESRKAVKEKKFKDQTKQEAIDEITRAEKQATNSLNESINQETKNECTQIKDLRAAFDTAHIKHFDKSKFSLFNIRVEECGPFVYATLANEEELGPAREILGDMVPELKNYPLNELISVRSKQYESKCNWKLLAENFMEYMHLPSVHPALAKVSTVDAHYRRQGKGQYIGFVTNPLSSGGQPIDPGILPSMPGLKGSEHETGVFHHVFPNAFYFLLPSHIFTVRLEPKSPMLTIEHADLLVHPSLLEDAKVKEETEILNKKLDDIMDFYDMTNLEDIEISESVQEGIKAEQYHGGRVSFRFEETIHRFQNMLIDHMTNNYGRIPLGDESIPYYIGGLKDYESKSIRPYKN